MHHLTDKVIFLLVLLSAVLNAMSYLNGGSTHIPQLWERLKPSGTRFRIPLQADGFSDWCIFKRTTRAQQHWGSRARCASSSRDTALVGRALRGRGVPKAQQHALAAQGNRPPGGDRSNLLSMRQSLPWAGSRHRLRAAGARGRYHRDLIWLLPVLLAFAPETRAFPANSSEQNWNSLRDLVFYLEVCCLNPAEDGTSKLHLSTGSSDSTNSRRLNLTHPQAGMAKLYGKLPVSTARNAVS